MDRRQKTREQAYLHLLKWGLIFLRDAAFDGNLQLCRIESDHLHNMPDLSHEINELRHVYYLEGERAVYLEKLRAAGEVEYMDRTTARYRESWIALATAAGIPLAD